MPRKTTPSQVDTCCMILLCFLQRRVEFTETEKKMLDTKGYVESTTTIESSAYSLLKSFRDGCDDVCTVVGMHFMLWKHVLKMV